MGLETVKEEILNSAKEQANSMIAQARKEANRIEKEAAKKMEDKEQKNEAEIKKQIDTIKRQELAAAELNNKKMLLEAKKLLIESAFAEAKKKLENMDEKKREPIIKKLLEKAMGELEVSKIYCSKRDAKLLKGQNVQTAEMIGGLIAENKEGTVRIDYRFDTMLEVVKEKELQNISKVLF